MAPSAEAVSAPGWRAELGLGFVARQARTVLAHRHQRGPLHVQRPFYPEGDAVCHVYLLHPPGGVVGGDELHIDVRAETGAHALITTPAANKLYRSNGACASIEQRLHVAAGAALEWLPQETIAFDGAHARLATRVELAGDAGFIGWEILCLGRPVCAERYARGALHQRFEIRRDGKPLWLERARFEGDGPLLHGRWGMGGHAVTGTLVCVTRGTAPIAAVRAAVEAVCGPDACAVTQLDEVLIVRYLGDDTERARNAMKAAWERLRPALLQRAACAPRIWNT